MDVIPPGPTPPAPATGNAEPSLVAALASRDAARSEGHAVAVRHMFDRISPTYDLLNRLLSLGIDRGWRKRAIEVLRSRMPARGPVLDLCAGTLDLSAMLETECEGRVVVSADFAREMLLNGRAKLRNPARLAVADAMQMPFRNEAFAGVICAFGLRNLAEPKRGVADVHRVLSPGGAYVVLEFFRPVTLMTRMFHAVYARGVLPVVGRIVSGDGEAYGYLAQSMRGFMSRQELEVAMGEAGFRDVGSCDLTFGVASLVWGVK